MLGTIVTVALATSIVPAMSRFVLLSLLFKKCFKLRHCHSAFAVFLYVLRILVARSLVRLGLFSPLA